MKGPEEFFYIEKEHLKGRKIFPFHIYLYNPNTNQHTPFLYANSPLTSNKEFFLDYALERHGEIAIAENQQKTFFTTMELSKEDIPSLQEEELEEIEIEREKRVQALIEKRTNNEESIFDLKTGFKECEKNDNFLPMILAAQEEIMTFGLRVSATVSLASYLAEKVLTIDNITNRIVAVSYFLAKNCDIKDEESLSDLICASFFCHLGMTQMDFYLNHKPQVELNDTEKKKFKKHPGYSHHFVLKAQLDISDRCKHIIFQHHERYDGSGYPSMRQGDYIDQLALIIGAIAHLFEYSQGKVAGTKKPLRSIIKNLKNKTLTSGLELEFGDKILENLSLIINTEEEHSNLDNRDSENMAA